MNHLSLEAKEAIVLKAINQNGASIKLIAKSHNVGYSSLQKWVKCYREGLPLSKRKQVSASAKQLSRTDQLNHLLATHGLDEVSLGKYCRKHGLYSYQLAEWQESLVKPPKPNNNQLKKAEMKKLKDENKRLQKELRRKEKALAEASALLILKKKADLIWGVGEED
jgi:transposase